MISNWRHWTYPLRPDKSEVEIFLNILEMLPSHKNILILGSTPELRDSAFITDKNVTCVDMNSSTMRMMRNNMKYRKYISDTNEALIECDWLEMDQHPILSDQQFDLILAEESINMLQFQDWITFLDQILSRLKDTGFFVIKAMIKPPSGYFNDVDSVDEIINSWMKSDYQHDFGYLFVHLLAYLNEKKNENECINWKEVLESVAKADMNGNIKWSKQQRQAFLDRFGCLMEDDFVFYCMTEESIREMMIERGFYFENVHYGQHDANKYKFTPIYVLGKQSWLIGGEARKLTTAEQELSTMNRLDHIAQ